VKQEWWREMCIDQCNPNEGMGLAYFRLGIWKLRGKRRDVEKGTCLLYDEEENLVHRLLKCKETPRWREQFLDNTRLFTNGDREYNKTIILPGRSFI
jgi:hypothetical protein